MITKDFETAILNYVFRGESDSVGQFFVGLCNNQTASRDMTLADLAEVQGDGYARIEVPRTSVGWLEVLDQSDCQSIRTSEVIFTPSGQWSPFTRMFLCDCASGTEGKLLAISTPQPSEVTLNSGSSYPVSFELYLK